MPCTSKYTKNQHRPGFKQKYHKLSSHETTISSVQRQVIRRDLLVYFPLTLRKLFQMRTYLKQNG